MRRHVRDAAALVGAIRANASAVKTRRETKICKKPKETKRFGVEVS